MAEPCFPEPCKGGRTVARGGGSAEGADATPAGAALRPCHGCRCRGRRLRSGFRPPSAPAPGNGIPFRAPACLRRPSRGSARRFAARSPLAMLRRPLAGASLGRNAAFLHGGRALPDFMKSPCFPKWRFYRPSWGSITEKHGGVAKPPMAIILTQLLCSSSHCVFCLRLVPHSPHNGSAESTIYRQPSSQPCIIFGFKAFAGV